MDFKTDVTLGLKYPLNPPLMNGRGCIKTVEHVRDAAKSLAGAVVGGSFTFHSRVGNEGDVLWSGPNGTLNSWGMPNGGIPYLEKNMPEMVEICHDAGKPFIANVAGFSVVDYVTMVQVCRRLGADAVELNFGCPNVVLADGSRKPIPSYDPEYFDGILNNVLATIGNNFPLWVKVSPNFNGDQIIKLARIVSQYRCIKAVTTMNTVPNCYAVDEKGKSRISVGLAG